MQIVGSLRALSTLEKPQQDMTQATSVCLRQRRYSTCGSTSHTVQTQRLSFLLLHSSFSLSFLSFINIINNSNIGKQIPAGVRFEPGTSQILFRNSYHKRTNKNNGKTNRLLSYDTDRRENVACNNSLFLRERLYRVVT
jgi:hypothetical protein